MLIRGSQCSKMNYARAVKGQSARGDAQRRVDAQSELELGRPLSDSEKLALFGKFSANYVSSEIDKVSITRF